MKSTLNYFFFADGFRISIHIILIISIILNLFVLKSLSIMNQKFSLIFIILINVIICSSMHGIAYIIDWIPQDNKELLFGPDFICNLQSFFICFFIEARESFATSITIIMFLNEWLHTKIKRSCITLSISMLIGYLFPFILNIFFYINGGYGKSHLYCLTNYEKEGNHSLIFHFLYIIIFHIISIVLSAILFIYAFIRNRQEREATLWQLIKKIILFPLAQIIFIALPNIYEILIMIYGSEQENLQNFLVYLAGISAVICTFPAIGYTLIFALSNNLFSIIISGINDDDDQERIPTEMELGDPNDD